MSTEQALTFTVQGKPIPKQSFQYGNKKGWTPKRIKDHQSLVASTGRQAAHDAGIALPIDKWYHVAITFHGANPLADLDNLEKLVLDALQDADILENDKYVMSKNTLRNPFPSDNPRTIITVKSKGEY